MKTESFFCNQLKELIEIYCLHEALSPYGHGTWIHKQQNILHWPSGSKFASSSSSASTALHSPIQYFLVRTATFVTPIFHVAALIRNEHFCDFDVDTLGAQMLTGFDNSVFIFSSFSHAEN